MNMTGRTRRRRRSTKNGRRRTTARRRKSRRGRRAHDIRLEMVDQNCFCAGTQLKCVKVWRARHHRIRTCVQRSKWRSNCIPVNKDVRSLEESRGEILRRRG